MSLFAWANKQLESLADKIAPVSNDPGYRFSQALRSNDARLALALLSQSPPPFPDGTYSSPVDPYSTVINRQNGSLAIHCAAEHAQSDVVFALIAQHGVPAEQFDSQGNTPLHYAAFSRSPAALNLVKALVTQYNVSVTVKNALGQTPYDNAVQDSIRQYLLPIQLQRETQECIDNGGHGLPQGIDMGGITIKRDIPPPPIGGMGSPSLSQGPPPIGRGVNNYSAGARAGGSNYFAPSYGTDVSVGGHQIPPSGSYPPHATNTPAQSYSNQPSMGSSQPINIDPSPVPAPFPAVGAQPNPPSASYLGHMANAPATSFSSQPTNVDPSSSSTPGLTPHIPIQEPAPTQTLGAPNTTDITPENPESVVATGTTKEISSIEPTPTEPKLDNKEDESKSVENKAIPSAAPIVEAKDPQPAPYFQPTTSSFTSTTGSTFANTSENTPNPNPAPTSGSQYARKGHSSAAVLPTGAKYKPDGFHSSSSDVSLQQKYGHDASITGPPSGNYARQVAPPPSGGSAPPSGNSQAKQNPYARGSSAPNSYSAYGGAGAIGRARYPTYDAVSDTVGAAHGYNAHSYNTASPAPVPQYNVYTPNTNQYQATQAQGYQQQTYDHNQQQGYNYGQQQGCQQEQQQYQYQQTNNYSQQQASYGYNQQQQQTNYSYHHQQQSVYDYSQQQPQQTSEHKQTSNEVNVAPVQNTEVQATSPQQTEQTSPAAAPVAALQTETKIIAQDETVPVQNVSEKVKNLDIGADKSPAMEQTAANSADELFGAVTSPSMNITNEVESSANPTTASAADLFGSPVAQVAPVLTADDIDDSLPPPPIASENIILETEPDDDLPPPPIGGTETSDDADVDGDVLPPPPMMDVAL